MPPNFFLVGAAKAGTTSFYNYLAQHPQIYMSPIKEPNFFADEVRVENFSPEFLPKLQRWQHDLRTYLDGPRTEPFASGPVCDWQDYLRLFEPAKDEIAIGEASPTYLWSRTAASNIASRCPDAKILMILRNPVDRAFSQHLHTLSFAARPISFREQINAALRLTEPRIGELYPFLEFGMYAGQVARLLQYFERARIHILLYEDYVANPRGAIRDTFRFLEVDPDFAPDIAQKHMTASVPRWFALNRRRQERSVLHSAYRLVPHSIRRMAASVLLRSRKTMSIARQDRDFLIDYYSADVRQLSYILGVDLSGWLRKP